LGVSKTLVAEAGGGLPSSRATGASAARTAPAAQVGAGSFGAREWVDFGTTAEVS